MSQANHIILVRDPKPCQSTPTRPVRHSLALVFSAGGNERLTLAAVLALAVALSLDSLGVGVAYGLRRIRLPWSLYLVVALCTGALMGLSMTLGRHLSGYLAPVIAHRVGGAILVGVGVWQLYQGWQGYRRRLATPGNDETSEPRQVLKLDFQALGLVVQILVEPVAADVDHSGEIDPRESVALGVALGLDSLGAGLGAGMAGYGLAAIPAVAFACAAFVRLGCWAAGHPAGDRLTRKAFFLPGVLLMLLGALRL